MRLQGRRQVFKKFVHRTLRHAGLGVVRVRDPYVDMARLAGPGAVATAIDGGAYRGIATDRLRAVFPGVQVHAFEPQRESFADLCLRFANQPDVHLHDCALSDSDGEQPFFVNDVAYTSSLLAPSTPAMHTIEKRRVRTRRLDDVLAEAGGAPVDVIKLDLQGNELTALHGGQQALASCRALLTEVNFRPRYAGACSFETLAAFVDRFGLHLYRFYDICNSDDQGWLQADALFVRQP
ncbi:MAG TPA: FkbM family methyltransferase [Rhodanobacteraceae bacterium]|nr:FkbM family methyltransferase [Rhodanobacteraceae bacterium]